MACKANVKVIVWTWDIFLVEIMTGHNGLQEEITFRPEALGNAFRVEASIIVDKAKNVLHIPISALFRHNEHWSTFVLRDGRARLRAVGVGKKNDREAEILNGLDIGDQVIIHPGNNIRDDTRAALRQ